MKKTNNEENKLRIGRFDISSGKPSDSKVWIQINELDPANCGEGGEFPIYDNF